MIGKIVSLNKSFSASTERALLLYQLLKSKKPFKWYKKCDEALEKVTSYLSSPLIPMSPTLDEVLHP
ncbi:hypothetical protein, partial [Klebsiella pneumoniae]|uniref:hypothetical protein n=1 Tax=Klebsiella pneumoniae TaxID=573 RepID=UPI001D0F10FD